MWPHVIITLYFEVLHNPCIQGQPIHDDPIVQNCGLYHPCRRAGAKTTREFLRQDEGCHTALATPFTSPARCGRSKISCHKYVCQIALKKIRSTRDVSVTKIYLSCAIRNKCFGAGYHVNQRSPASPHGLSTALEVLSSPRQKLAVPLPPCHHGVHQSWWCVREVLAPVSKIWARGHRICFQGEYFV